MHTCTYKQAHENKECVYRKILLNFILFDKQTSLARQNSEKYQSQSLMASINSDARPIITIF